MQDKISIKSQNMSDLSKYREYLREYPRLMYLFVELTDRCNLACLHCGSSCEQGKGSFIDTDMLLSTLETVAQDFEPSNVMICLTGGEPMLHKDFYVIVEKINELGFPWGMTTNATLIDATAAKRLRELKLQSITISLDGLEQTHEWLRSVKGCFGKTVQAVKYLNDEGIRVQITSVIHKHNFAELDDMYGLMCEMNVYSWRVINLEPIGRALDDKSLLLSRKEFIHLLEFIREKRFSSDTPMDVCFGCSHYLSYEYEHEVRDNYFICGSGIYVASILCNGDIYSCLDIERRPELVQGNVLTDRFSDVWFNKFKEFRTDRTSQCEMCDKCKEKAFCNGDSTHTWDFENKKPMFCMLREV